MSVWVEIFTIFVLPVAFSSRSTWACELKCKIISTGVDFNGVTLHVSVWVEIKDFRYCIKNYPPSRSTWACELKSVEWFLDNQEIAVTLHVSVWVEIRYTHWRVGVRWSRSTWACELKFVKICKYGWGLLSRSTWACELKFDRWSFKRVSLRHAPRERVSWNMDKDFLRYAIGKSRSTWACELK